MLMRGVEFLMRVDYFAGHLRGFGEKLFGNIVYPEAIAVGRGIDDLRALAVIGEGDNNI